MITCHDNESTGGVLIYSRYIDRQQCHNFSFEPIHGNWIHEVRKYRQKIEKSSTLEYRFRVERKSIEQCSPPETFRIGVDLINGMHAVDHPWYFGAVFSWKYFDDKLTAIFRFYTLSYFWFGNRTLIEILTSNERHMKIIAFSPLNKS